ncbi:hypothetical protein DICPUDRAFT_153431 [Dictyostelium purpureum]|uniref:Uncharacterized protein n=1 Tax=Dictyostelium purpureum TaxID=5786 RepID=F0ZNW3_DICPU|nr:uncharacterized protein DICPUDRAFT_153431 [Dictyostelium purpureum]EGC34378.1 hypothetical protein DICPUDRAFT_153431 [Dictyostelium purpureum]|eukprot:XP_003289112.1 hypothetical protein DICPUDRAFT_153431 [Dictyostelium purpureum]
MTSTIQQTYLFLEKILPIIKNEIGNVDKEITLQKEKIDNISKLLKELTSNIVELEEQEQQFQNNLNQYSEQKAQDESTLKDLQDEIDKSSKEAARLQAEIDKYQKMLDEMAELDPLAAEITSLVEKIKGDFDQVTNKINALNENIKTLNASLEKTQADEDALNQKIEVATAHKIQLLNLQDEKNQNIKQLGVDRTNAENYRLDLMNLRDKLEDISKSIELGKEFKDDSLVSKEEIEKEIKALYIKHNRNVPNGLLN